MLARQRLEHLTELVTRIEAELENGQGLASQIGRAATAMLELARRSSNWEHGTGAADACVGTASRDDATGSARA